LGLALAADVRLMSAAATVTTGYTRRGLCPDAGVSYFLPRVVGLSRAMDLVLTARDVAAEEAERIGLVSQVLPAEGFQAAALDYATRLAAGAPVALALSKRLVATSLDAELGDQLRKEFSSIRACFATEDLQEALRAFGEKRTPRFVGR
jgi:2-(1,2-epoxy-1,2-dihydrophenyl)acetyl-CoA isomerase